VIATRTLPFLGKARRKTRVLLFTKEQNMTKDDAVYRLIKAFAWAEPLPYVRHVDVGVEVLPAIGDATGSEDSDCRASAKASGRKLAVLTVARHYRLLVNDGTSTWVDLRNLRSLSRIMSPVVLPRQKKNSRRCLAQTIIEGCMPVGRNWRVYPFTGEVGYVLSSGQYVSITCRDVVQHLNLTSRDNFCFLALDDVPNEVDILINEVSRTQYVKSDPVYANVFLPSLKISTSIKGRTDLPSCPWGKPSKWKTK